MSLPPPREASRATGQGLIISKYPDVCRSPHAPVPYTIVGYQNDDANTASSVFMTGQRAHKQNSIVIKCTGDEPGVGLGVKSNTVSSICHRKDHSRTVRIEGQWATRDTDEWWMNNRNTIGKLCWPKHNKSFDPTPPFVVADASATTGSDEGKVMSDASPEPLAMNAQYAFNNLAVAPKADRFAVVPSQARQAGTVHPLPETPLPKGNGGIPGVNMRTGNTQLPQHGNQNNPWASPPSGDDQPFKTPPSWARFWAQAQAAVYLGVYELASWRFETMPQRLDEALMEGHRQHLAQLDENKARSDAYAFKQTPLGKSYPGDLEDWERESAERRASFRRELEEKRREKLKAEEEQHSAPPHERTDQGASVKGREKEEDEDDEQCGCIVGTYKEIRGRCTVECGDTYQAHHIVPDFTKRYVARKDGMGAAGRIKGLASFNDGASICLQGMAKDDGSEHFEAHGADKRIVELGKHAGTPAFPTGTARIEDIKDATVQQVKDVRKDCSVLIDLEIHKEFYDVNPNTLGRTTIDKLPVGDALKALSSRFTSSTIH